MKLTAQTFLDMLSNKGIKYSVQQENIILDGSDKKLISRLYEVLDKNTNFKSGLILHLNSKSSMSCSEYLLALESAGMKVEVDTWLEYTLTGGKDKARLRLICVLENDNYLKACVILSQAMKDETLLDIVQERACIRWENGYSDSLIMAVMSGFTTTGETCERDENGQIILKPKTDWELELSSLK